VTTQGISVNWLEPGPRLHLQHGPIDLIVEAHGAACECQRAYQQGIDAFQDVLLTLVDELPVLRNPCATKPAGPVGQRMFDAVNSCQQGFITPMAAVAGAVADHILESMCKGRQLDRLFVNNGGDIALYLAHGQSATLSLVDNVDKPSRASRATLSGSGNVGGIATSGWQGRSHSLGIADAVNVFAVDAATADAAATVIANATNVVSPDKIHRVPADELDDNTDLGNLPVTVSVAELAEHEQRQALNAGKQIALNLIEQQRILGARIVLQDHIEIVLSHLEKLPIEQTRLTV